MFEDDEFFFPLYPRGTTEFWRPKKPFFGVDMDWGALYFISTKSHAHKRDGTLRKKNSTRGYAEIYIQSLLFDN
jgi:hypothetical protein